MNDMTRFYRIADVTFRVTGDSWRMYREEGVLAAFRVEASQWDHSVRYEILDSLPLPEGECVYEGSRIQVFRQGDTQLICQGNAARLPESAYTHIIRCGNETLVRVLAREVPKGILPRLVLNTLEAEHHIARHGGLLLHASFIRWNDRAILFTAPSGTGKSTQAALWERHRGAEIINGDRTAVTVEEGVAMAHGIPYCGTSGICKREKLPVAAIVYLTQAPRSEVRPLQGVAAFRRLWEGCSVQLWDRGDVEQSAQTVMQLIGRVPVLHLACTPDESAVQALETYLKERK